MLLRNGLPKQVIEGNTEGYKLRVDDEKDVSSYWMTLRKRQDN